MRSPGARLGALALVLALSAWGEAPKGTIHQRFQAVEEALDSDDLPTAKSLLDDLQRQAGQDVAPLDFFEGQLAFESGDYAKAVSLLEKAGLDDKPGSYLRLAKDTVKALEDHHTAQSAHFVFSYPDGKDEILAPYALLALESQRTALEADLGYAPPDRIRVEVVRDGPELARLSTLTEKQIETTGTIAISKFNKLIITSPKAVLRGYDWQDTLAHEYTHLVVTRLGKNKVPIWLQEGLAKFLESRWHGPPGQDLLPSSRALLGVRVKQNRLVTFKQMYPSMAMLPSAEDAETAFAEVFLAVDYIYRHKGDGALRRIILDMGEGMTDQQAVADAMGTPFAQFEKDWRDYLAQQPYPRFLIPRSDATPVLKDARHPAKKKERREISFGDFTEVREPGARRFAHLGELMRERDRNGAAAQEYAKAYAIVGDRYESISNKYALALLAIRQLDTAEKVLLASLQLHPGSPQTHVHLGRIYLARKDWERAKHAYLDALAEDPFDPEIHLALLDAATHLHDGALAQRARDAAIRLTGLHGVTVDQIAHNLMRSRADLAEVPLPQAADAGTPSPGATGSPSSNALRGAPDAGR